MSTAVPGRIGFLGISLAVLGSVAACGSGGDNNTADASPPDAIPVDAAVAPVLVNPVNLPDVQLATEALQLLGHSAVGGSKKCNACHGLTRQKLSLWRAYSDDSLSTCLTDLGIATKESALGMINCLREDPADDTSRFQAKKLGAYSTATHLRWFEFLFWRAYGDDAEANWKAFIGRVGMPKGEHVPYTQPELDIVIEWFKRGLPEMNNVLPNDPPPSTCTPAISADVTAHVEQMKLSGWGAVNKENNLLMHGCGGAATPLECLSTYPRASDQSYGAGWESLPLAKLRILKEITYKSVFWTRSSADGRFVAHGAGDVGSNFDSAIIDLATDKVIPTRAFYDPAFFPDNSGFVFQGFRAYLCNHSLLTDEPTEINYNESDCSSTRRVGLYEHVGASLGGGDYWSIDSQFESDNDGFDPTLKDPDAPFGSNASVTFTPLIHDGSNYSAGSTVDVDQAFEGDSVISHSAKLLVNRVAGPSDSQLGFVLRRVDATPDGDGGYDVQTPEIARYCFNGGKPHFSFDERWMVTHHYVGDDDAVDMGFTGPSDPAFAQYKTEGAANVYLIDLVTGTTIRVTGMAPGQYALFPHFRADGWIYFIVRNISDTTEYIVASDAALVLENTP